jgi:hypothetical protein
MASDYLLGLDLGQASDLSALAIVRRSPAPDGDGRLARDHRGELLWAYHCLHLERFPRGTAYPAVVDRVDALVRSGKVGSQPSLAIDATGVGRPVVDLFLDRRIPAEVHPLTITAGSASREDNWNRTALRAFWVPKLELVSTVQALLQTGRLRIVPRLELADVLRRELLEFRVRVTSSANETFNAREGAHDDLVLALASAAWLGERQTSQPIVAASPRFPAPVSRDRPTRPRHWAARSIEQKIRYYR